MTRLLFLIMLFFTQVGAMAQDEGVPFIMILGIAQDGGYPHMGCNKPCCARAWANDTASRFVVSLAIVDPASKKWWLIEATPDIKYQLRYFQQLTGGRFNYLPDGIFLTHAHIGHYTGLMQLGREVMNTSKIPVYSLPKMKDFLENNGPWSQLVKLENISLNLLQADSPLQLTPGIRVTAFTVPHRDEFSETAGFSIYTPSKKYLFIPDVNKWDKWDRNIITEVQRTDIALLDGTFFDDTELPGRKMSEVPHPFVKETMLLFSKTGIETTSKIHFIHLNHTNPVLWDQTKQDSLRTAGFNIARQGEKL